MFLSYSSSHQGKGGHWEKRRESKVKVSSCFDLNFGCVNSHEASTLFLNSKMETSPGTRPRGLSLTNNFHHGGETTPPPTTLGESGTTTTSGNMKTPTPPCRRREPSVTCNGNPIHGLMTSLTHPGQCPPSSYPREDQGDSSAPRPTAVLPSSPSPSSNGWSCKLQSVPSPEFGPSTLPISLTGYLGSWKKNRNLCGNFCVSGDTMEGIVQCLVFLKAFSVRKLYFSFSFGDY